MVKGPFISDFPTKLSISRGFPIAMFEYQMFRVISQGQKSATKAHYAASSCAASDGAVVECSEPFGSEIQSLCIWSELAGSAVLGNLGSSQTYGGYISHI